MALNPEESALAAGLVELFAERANQKPPAWTATVPASPVPFWPVRAALVMPRWKKMCEKEGPLPLRRRAIYAPPDFLTII